MNFQPARKYEIAQKRAKWTGKKYSCKIHEKVMEAVSWILWIWNFVVEQNPARIVEPLAQTCTAQKSRLKFLCTIYNFKNHDKTGQKNEYGPFLLLTFTKQGVKISNANEMIHRVFVGYVKYRANSLICFVDARIFVASVPQKMGSVSVCFCGAGETC